MIDSGITLTSKDIFSYAKKCRICQQTCDRLQTNIAFLYCCLHVPAYKIGKMLDQWLCISCAQRRCMH